MFRFIGLLSILLLSTAAFSAPGRLPVFEQIGVIPVQWEEATDAREYSINAKRDFIVEEFSTSVRASNRFKVINDQVIASLWNTPAGRKELVDQFELHAFVSLNVVKKPDTVLFMTRFLSPDMTTLLIESESVPAGKFSSANNKEIREILAQLIFRLFNRLPIDVSVTSVQGAYITVSGGENQGVQIGDKIDLVRAEASTLHPANGAWLNFKVTNLGEAEIIEAKEYSSVARLIKQNYVDAVEVGDGARIPKLASRKKFARPEPTSLLAQNSKVDEIIIVPPLYASDKSGKKPDTKSIATNTTAGGDNSSSPQNASDQSGESGDSGSNPNIPADTPADGGKDPTKFVGISEFVAKPVDKITAYVGPHMWWVSGPVAANGEFPLWLANRAGANMTRQFYPHFHFGAGGGLLFGGTQKGSYFGYEANGRIYFEDQLNLGTPLIKNFRAGGDAVFSGMGVAEEVFGGGDWIKIGAFGAVDGQIELAQWGQNLDWFGEFDLYTLTLGRYGYRKAEYTVRSSIGYNFQIGAFLPNPKASIEWGGAMNYGNHNMLLSNSKEASLSQFNLMLLGKYKF